ncbi:MAG: hypothetical protein ACRDD1_22330 [Planctomycetia bacterium]
MVIRRRETSDAEMEEILNALAKYESLHPNAEIDANRRNNVTMRVRIIDPDFKGVDRKTRHDDVWNHLEVLPEEVLSQLTMLLLITPDEKKNSIASIDFDRPATSRL